MSVLSPVMCNVCFQHKDVLYLALGQVALLPAQLRILLTVLTCIFVEYLFKQGTLNTLY